ncbi:hypothetical protein HPB47_012475 [Ixodes persulcatus]|uniref:Uncharacterized protein n=1 Tax=Ixodes persulcatus TaxID=34615 RepID=A0AC60NTD2_IXOPE|nr:hypothetical protein HPB47_012475 [Ixodes persulcatus]
MTGSKDVCGSFSAQFFGRQQFLHCSGICGLRFHCKCINVAAEDYDLLMKNGTSSYKCSSCTRRKGVDNVPSTDDSSLFDSTNAELPAVGSGEGDFRELLKILLNKIDGLSADVKCLRVDNESLRVQLAQNNALLRKSLPHVPEAVRGLAPKSFSSAVQLPNVRLQDAEPPSTQQQNLASVSGSRTEEGPSQPDRRQTVDEDGYTIVRRKQKTKVVEGTRAESRLGVVPRPPRKRALFVSRLSPSTTASNVCEVLEDVLQGKSVHCTKLLSKYDSYASFHVCVDTDCFDMINDPNVWPSGCLFRPFFGALKIDPTATSLSSNK